jgi:NitT/TauT family transport system substrate-binding protein
MVGAIRGCACAAAFVVSFAISPLSAQTLPHVAIGTVQSVPAASTYIALDKGYFREAGVDVSIDVIDSLSKAMALLATNQLQIAQGGINAGYFNAVGQGLPIVMALEGGSTPVYHNFVLRPDLVGIVKTAADLKGRRIAVSGSGTLSTYELGVLLESVGLRLSDVDVKALAFPQMAPALASKAVDVALMVAPFSDFAIAQKFAVPWIDPEAGPVKVLPMTALAYMASADWIAHDGDMARKVFIALARGARDYCQAYHHGPNRAEVVDLMVRHGIGKDAASLDRMNWQARDPNGAFNAASIHDIKRLFAKEGFIQNDPLDGKLVDARFSADAARELGPFEVINKASTLKGCR